MVGGRDRDRTGDPLLAKQVLSQLSYTPTVVTFFDSKAFVAGRKLLNVTLYPPLVPELPRFHSRPAALKPFPEYRTIPPHLYHLSRRLRPRSKARLALRGAFENRAPYRRTRLLADMVRASVRGQGHH